MINEGWFTKYEKCANELKGVFFSIAGRQQLLEERRRINDDKVINNNKQK